MILDFGIIFGICIQVISDDVIYFLNFYIWPHGVREHHKINM